MNRDGKDIQTNRGTVEEGSLPGFLGNAGKSKEVSGVFATLLGRGYDPGNEVPGTVQTYWLETIEKISKEKGIWIDSLSSVASRVLGYGHENTVFRSKDGKNVIKFNNFRYVYDEESLIRFIERINSHNEFCMNVPYSLLGFTRNPDGIIGLVMSQPYVNRGMEADSYTISEYLKRQGFRNDYLTFGERKGWTNGVYEFTDAVPRNVLQDQNGYLYFIDLQINNPKRLKNYLSAYSDFIQTRNSVVDTAVRLSHCLFPGERITEAEKHSIKDFFSAFKTAKERQSAMDIIRELSEARPDVRDARIWRENAFETIERQAGLSEQQGEFQSRKK